MSIIPVLRAAKIVATLLKAGFRVVRQTGSHIKLEHNSDKSRWATVPMHSKDISRAILSSILKQAKLSISEFLKLLGK